MILDSDSESDESRADRQTDRQTEGPLTCSQKSGVSFDLTALIQEQKQQHSTKLLQTLNLEMLMSQQMEGMVMDVIQTDSCTSCGVGHIIRAREFVSGSGATVVV